MNGEPRLSGIARLPLLSGIVVHWGAAADLTAWPSDPRFELIVVDNGPATSSGPTLPSSGRLLRPGHNLGFAGGVNYGAALARAPLLLLLNSDAHPETGALEALLAGFTRYPDAAGLAPRLEGEDGESQFAWQLRPLPAPGALLRQALFLPGVRGPRQEPAAGAQVEQPAAAALALRKADFDAIAGMDESFYPAWFEDVDLALRLHQAGRSLLYLPAARFHHRLGSSAVELGYGRFLWIYHRNLEHYLRKHHGPLWALAARTLLALAAPLRLLLVPLRRPRRALSRREAAAGLWVVFLGAASGWRRPRLFAGAFDPAVPPKDSE